MDLHNRLLILLFPNVSIVIILIISAITVKMKIRVFIVLQRFREDCWVYFQDFRYKISQMHSVAGRWWLLVVWGWLKLISGSLWLVARNFGWFWMVSDSFGWFRMVCCFSRYRPEIFYLSYTIHALNKTQVFPCVFALLPNKNEDKWNRLFREVRNAIIRRGNEPADILMDFWKSCIKRCHQSDATTTGSES